MRVIKTYVIERNAKNSICIERATVGLHDCLRVKVRFTNTLVINAHLLSKLAVGNYLQFYSLVVY